MSRRNDPVERVRSFMYLGQRGLGDYQAARRGPAPYARRIARRRVTRATGLAGTLLGSILRGMIR